MRKFLALVSARNKEFYRDRTTLIWTFIFPFVVLLGFAYGYSGRDEAMFKIGVYPPSAVNQEVLKEFASIPQLEIIKYDNEEQPLRRVGRHQLDLFLKVDSKSLAGTGGEAGSIAYWINPESTKASLVERILRTSLPKGAVMQKQEFVGRKLRYADWLVPGMIGMNLMFGALFGVGYVIVRYRKNGVLKRLRATPLSSFEFLLAQVISRTLLLVATSAVTVLGASLLIGFKMAGSWFDLFAFIAIGSSSLIAIGMLVAARISSEEVADGVLNMMTWPMIFLSGVWFSLDGASSWVTSISRALPLTHVVDGLRAIMIEGESLSNLAPQLMALSAGAFVLLMIGSAIFKWR